MTTPPTPLRARLQDDLAPLHQRLDDLFSEFDLTSRLGLTGFLAAHRAGFAAIRPAPGGATGQALLDRMIAALDTDLDRLGEAPLPAPAPLRITRAMAQDYVLLGSRLGSQVLRRRWAAATDPVLRRAGAYLSLPPMGRDWRAFCERAGDTQGLGTEADIVVAEAGALFDLFLTAGHSAKGSFATVAPRAMATERTA